MAVYIVIGVLIVLIIINLLLWGKLESRLVYLENIHTNTQKSLIDVNRNYAIIERIITPFMEWVEQVKEQQRADVKDAAERAEAFQKAKLMPRPRPTE